MEQPTKKEILDYYSRSEIQKAMVAEALDREVGVRFGGGFGKRPDILAFPGDVLDCAKKGCTSFHISEERWNDALELKPGMPKKQLDELRKGWDFIIDIDITDWEVSKYISYLIVETLRYHNIKNIGTKFSGNKGLHIVVPYESFPDTINNMETKNVYPDALRIMAEFITDFIREALTKWVNSKDPQRREEILKALEQEKEIEDDLKFAKDNMPKRPMGVVRAGSTTITHDNVDKKLKAGLKNAIKLSGNQIDTVLISTRHLFRAPYSLHEKSGLASIPIEPDKVLEFDKEYAKPQNVKETRKFIDRDKSVKGEAREFVIQAMDWHARNKKEEEKTEDSNKTFEMPKSAIPEELFPPCLKNILKGNQEDGKKRSLFVLLKFLKHMGWNWENIEKILKEWNGKNPEPLRENYLLSQITWHKRQNGSVLPPNCQNAAYYKDLRVCMPEPLCAKIKNPVNNAIIKARSKEEAQQTKETQASEK